MLACACILVSDVSQTPYTTPGLTWHQPAAVHGSGSTMCSVKFGVVIIARFLFSNIIFNQRICDLCTRVDVNTDCVQLCVYTTGVYKGTVSTMMPACFCARPLPTCLSTEQTSLYYCVIQFTLHPPFLLGSFFARFSPWQLQRRRFHNLVERQVCDTDLPGRCDATLRDCCPCWNSKPGRILHRMQRC